jgi:hypothetical protein
MKNTSWQGVLTLEIKIYSFGSPGGLQVPTFGRTSFILTLASKWSCDTCGMVCVFFGGEGGE